MLQIKTNYFYSDVEVFNEEHSIPCHLIRQDRGNYSL